jgi:hypothetical protein
LKEVKCMPFEAKFTRKYLSIGSDKYGGTYKCRCIRCPCHVSGGNPACSDQCGGYTATNKQPYGMYGCGPSMYDEGQSCYHDHSRCMIPDCNLPGDYAEYFKVDASNHQPGIIPQPFCKFHAQKCECGLPRVTKKFYPPRTTPASSAEIELMHASYEKTCTSKHHFVCPRPECKNLLTHVCCPKTSSYELTVFCRQFVCNDHTPICTYCNKNKLAPKPGSRETYFERCSDCSYKLWKDKQLGDTMECAIHCGTPDCDKFVPLLYRKQMHSNGIITEFLPQHQCVDCAPKCASCHTAPRLSRSGKYKYPMSLGEKEEYYDNCYHCNVIKEIKDSAMIPSSISDLFPFTIC